ncbi:hypothetical protein ACFFRR_009332 [Megaselia abdita]
MKTNFNLMESLGFDETSTWMLYDENLQKIFNFLENNITEDNILTNQEKQLAFDLESRNALLSEIECDEILIELSEKFDSIHLNEDLDKQITSLEFEIRNLKKVQGLYENVNVEMKRHLETKTPRTSSMEMKIIDMETVEKQSQEKCLALANQLQETQKENKKLSNEAEDCFSRMKTPTLFMHQMPLDHYFQKTENFINYVKIYMKENFKISCDDGSVFECILNEDVDKLDSIRKTNLYYTEEYYKTKAQNKAIEAMIKVFDVDRLHITNLNEIKKETKELIQMNENLDIAHETLLNDLHIVLEELTVQEHEIILNAMLHRKLQIHADRLENVKCLSQTVSKSLTIAEIVWFILQMDLEKTRARYDNTDDLITESQKVQKRIQLMKSFENRNDAILADLNQKHYLKISEVLGNLKSLKNSKNCLLEYEKFNRLLKYSINTLINGNHYASLNDVIAKIQESNIIFEKVVNESPFSKPIMESFKYVNEIFSAKMGISQMEDLYKNVRMDFQKMSSNMVGKKIYIFINYFISLKLD